MTSPLTTEKDLSKAVRISWFGHAMFLFEDGAGHRLVTDPYADYVGYPLPDVAADVVLVSHDHADHSNVGLVKENPAVLSSAGAQELGGVTVTGFSTFHDERRGAERGPNVIFRWGMQGLTFVHLGDLGHMLEGNLVKELSGADILFVPVGGTFTIDDAGAEEVVKMLGPRIAVPMHYRTEACGFPVNTEEPFAARFDHVERTGKQPVYISREDLPEPTLILIMDYIA
jgi:L-ascorbate metabolism protein UlaG (beta-lactamase superfamily)